MDIFDKLKSGESVDMMSAEYRPAIDELHRADRALFRLNHTEPYTQAWTGALNDLFDGHDHSGLGIMTPAQIEAANTIGNVLAVNV